MSPDRRIYPNRRQIAVTAATLASRAGELLDGGYRLALIAAHDDPGAFRGASFVAEGGTGSDALRYPVGDARFSSTCFPENRRYGSRSTPRMTTVLPL